MDAADVDDVVEAHELADETPELEPVDVAAILLDRVSLGVSLRCRRRLTVT